MDPANDGRVSMSAALGLAGSCALVGILVGAAGMRLVGGGEKPQSDLVVADPPSATPRSAIPNLPLSPTLDPPTPGPTTPGPKTPAPPPFADIHAVDPSALIENARARAPRGSKLTRLRAHFAGSNGLVDLAAPGYKANLRYTFSLPPIPAKQAPNAPLGVVTPAKYFPDTIVFYEGPDVNVGTDELGDMGAHATSEPKCTIAQVWAAAVAAGAPANAVADVTFPAEMSGGGRWNFYITGPGANGAGGFHTTIDDSTCKAPARKENDPLF
jgi:hypothetical protein